MTSALFILLCAVADRVRGGWAPFGFRPLWWERTAKFGYGAMLAALAGVDWQFWPVVAVLWWLGEKPGWGYPMGWAIVGRSPDEWDTTPHGPESWQIGWLSFMPYTSLAVRGAIWACPCLLVAWWQPDILKLLAMAIAMPLSAYAGGLASRRFGDRSEIAVDVDGWAIAEITRGGLCGLMVALL